jgi:transcription factor C subunit 6
MAVESNLELRLQATMALPAKDHRHRPGSLWCPPSGVTRLATKPDMFSAPNVLPTTSTDDLAIAHRVKKAWMYCISAGPCWELLEDRGFYKEEYTEYQHSSRSGRVQRPLVYTNLPSARKHNELLVG